MGRNGKLVFASRSRRFLTRGRRALARVVASLPEDFQVSVVVAQCLDPGVKITYERTELLGKIFRLDTHPERGTRVEITLDVTGGDE